MVRKSKKREKKKLVKKNKKKTKKIKKSTMENESVGEQEEEKKQKPTSTATPQKVFNTLIKHKQTLFLLFLILIPLVATVYTRTAHLDLPNIDKIVEKELDTKTLNTIGLQIQQANPHLPESEQQILIQRAVEKARTTKEYQAAFKKQTEEIRSAFYDNSGQMYLLAFDPYLWYRKTQNVLKYGHVGNTKKERCNNRGRCTLESFDTYLLAPNGDFVSVNLFPYLIAYTYKGVTLFSKDTSLLTILFYMPVALSLLISLSVFFITRKITRNNMASFFASLFVSVHLSLQKRSMAGFADTDVFSILYPLIIFWLLAKSIEKKAGMPQTIFWSWLAGVTTAAYAMTWGGWWFIFDTILLAATVYIGYQIILSIRKKESLKILITKKYFQKHILTFIITTGTTGLLVTLFLDFARFIKAPQTLLKTAEGLTAAAQGIWPNVYTSVSELSSITTGQFIEFTGGFLILLLGLIGVILFFLNKKKNKSVLATSGIFYTLVFALHKTLSLNLLVLLIAVPIAGTIIWLLYNKEGKSIFLPSFLAIWIGSMIFAGIKAQRFILVLIPALAITIGIVIKEIQEYASRSAKKHLHVNKIIVNILLIIILIFVLIKPVFIIDDEFGPELDDGWHNALTSIKQHSAKNAIIMAWWDYGHFYKAIGDRRVIFDGGTQNRPQAYWIGKALITSDEQESIGILRMLACGGNDAFDLLNKEVGDTTKSVKTLHTLIKMNREKGTNFLRKITKNNQEKAEQIAEKLYCNPPESYLITSSDLFKKSGAWAHFGSWDFNKAKIWAEARGKNKKELQKYLTQEFNYTQEEEQTIINQFGLVTNERDANIWIAPYPRFSKDIGPCRDPDSNNMLLCQGEIRTAEGKEIGLIYNISLETKHTVVANNKKKKTPQSVMWIDDDDGFHNKELDENSLSFGLAIIEQQDGWKTMTMTPELSGSMFTRLMLFNGKSLDHFKIVGVDRSYDIGSVYVWKIDWDRKEDSIKEAVINE